MIAAVFAAALSTAVSSPPSYARAAVEAQLARRPERRSAPALTGAEAQAMRKAYLEQLAEKRDLPKSQDQAPPSPRTQR